MGQRLQRHRAGACEKCEMGGDIGLCCFQNKTLTFQVSRAFQNHCKLGPVVCG